MNKGEYSRVHFRVRALTEIGETVGIGGSCNSLGSFQKNRIIPLVTTPESYPVWYTSKPIIVPRNKTFQYKYCLIESGECKQFEDDHNIHTFVSTEIDTMIEDQYIINSNLEEGTQSEQELLECLNVAEDLAHGKGFTASEPFVSQVKDLIKEGNTLYLVCYHLPVVVVRTSNPQTPFEVSWAESLIAKSEGSVSANIRTLWLGTVSVPGGTLTPQEQASLTELLNKMDCIPLFIDAEIARNCYQGYCKEIMWPVFHNVDQLDHIHAAWKVGGSDLSSDVNASPWSAWSDQIDLWYEAYQSVSQIFSEKLRSILKVDDIVWVHDYHLMLLPRLLRNNNEGISIVFFMHIPFPTSQIFRSLPSAIELLESMTCADVIGFHTFDFTRHFLNATKRMLGIRGRTRPGGLLGLEVGEREIIVTMSHVSVEPTPLQRVLDDPVTQELARQFKEKHAGKKIILSIDGCQRLSGGSLRMAAFEKLLDDQSSSALQGRSASSLGSGSGDGSNNGSRNVSLSSLSFDGTSTPPPSSQTGAAAVATTRQPFSGVKRLPGLEGSGPAPCKIVLVQRLIRTSARAEDEATTSQELRDMASAINSRFENAVDFEEVTSLTLQERVALYLSADVMLLTTIREGLNLMPMEYIFARKDLAHAGAVVASEFSVCSSLLSGALKINPFFSLAVADTLDKALHMDSVESVTRRQRDISFVTTKPSAMWTKQILMDLVLLRQMSDRTKTKASVTPLPEYVDSADICAAYACAAESGISLRCKRVFVFDYGGTLLHKEKYDIYIKQTLSAISGRKPTTEMMETIRRLSNDPANAVLVVTGLTKIKLGGIFDDLPNVTVVTSNGLLYSWGEGMATAEEIEVLERQQEQLSSSQQQQQHDGVVDHEAADTSAMDTSSGSEGPRSLPVTPSNAPVVMEGRGYDVARNRTWDYLDFDIDWNTVKNIAVPIITKFTFRTNGTCLSPRVPGIGWSYFGADPEWGRKQADQLKLELEASLANHDVMITSQIQGSIEIVPRALHKGVFVRHFLDRVMRMRAGKLPAFCCVIGDEPSDDRMFEALYDLIAECPPSACLAGMRAFTINVGKRETPADLFVHDVKDVEKLLTQLADCSGVEDEF